MEEVCFIPPEVERIMRLYVKPLNYDKIPENLKKHRAVIITGDANIGKTSTAYFTAGYFCKEKKKSLTIVRQGEKPSAIQDQVLVLDDPFGESELRDRGYYLSLNEVLKLRKKNDVIVSSRKQVLDAAVGETTLGEPFFNEWTVGIGQDGSYADDNLREILKKHLEYYTEKRAINEEDAEVARSNEGFIISQLRLPHNIDIFVKETLKEVKKGKSLEDAVEAAKWIKKVAKDWFLNLDDTRKFFVFTASIFPSYEEVFKEIYPRVIEALRKRKPELEIGDVADLGERASSFVNTWQWMSLRHPDYSEGITEAIRESLRGFLLDIVPLLPKLVNSKKWQLRRAAAYALGDIAQVRPDEATKILRDWAEDRDWRVRQEAAHALRGIGEVRPDEAMKTLKTLIDDEDLRVRIETAYALERVGEVRPDEAINTLRVLIEDKEPKVREEAGYALRAVGEVRPDKAISLLWGWVEDIDWRVRREAAYALGEIGDARPDDAVNTIRLQIKDGDSRVREAAAYALRGIREVRPDEAINILKILTEDEDARVREEAAFSLGYIGGVRPDEAISILETLTRDEDPDVRTTAAHTLFSLESQT